jgi:hypothetical protein
MNYWKIVEVGNYHVYTAKLLQLFLKQNQKYFDNVNSFWHSVKPQKIQELFKIIPELDDLTFLFGTIKELTVLTLFRDSSTLHIDHTIGLNKDVKARLNIPIINCEGSTTAFFDLDKNIFSLHTTGQEGTKVWSSALRKKLTPVTQVDLVQPTILRTSSPHTVFCHSCKFPRIALTVSFNIDLVHILDKR